MHFHSKLHNNTILTGAVDSYCLVCENYLRSEDEAFTHTEKPIHKKNMGVAVRVEEFVDDQIIKVKKGYYCPICNILLSTAPKVRIHIIDTRHQKKKTVHMLCRIGDYAIAFNEVAITLDSWHGLIDSTCVVCNTEFDELDFHRDDSGHALKLVQSQCEFGDRYVYRKVDEDSFFCLTCAGVFAIDEKLSHHENANHKNLYNFGKQLKNKIPPQAENEKSTSPKPEDNSTIKAIDNKVDTAKTEKSEKTENAKVTDKLFTKITHPEVKPTLVKGPEEPVQSKAKIFCRGIENTTLFVNSANTCKILDEQENIANGNVSKHEKDTATNKKQSEVLDRVDEFQRKGINIDFTWETVRCKNCSENIAFDVQSIEKHIEGHNQKKTAKNTEPKDIKKQPESIATNDVKTDKKDIKTKTDTKIQPEKPVNEVKLETKKTPSIPKSESVKPIKKSNDLNSDREEINSFVNGNKMLIKGNKAFCQQCKVDIELNMDTLKAHVNLSSHKGKNLDQNGRVVSSSSAVIKKLTRLDSSFNSHLIINDRYVLTLHSFHCIVMDDDTCMCAICDADLSKGGDRLTFHMNGPDHKDKLNLCKVVTSLPNEFVREIHPEIYHCGFCNEAVLCWTEMEEHLSNPMHGYIRSQANWDLERFQPHMRSAKTTHVGDLDNIHYA